MGLAAIMIILCHIPKYGVEVNSILRLILIYGNIGVDIFLLLSGLGCSFSLSKNKNLSSWYKKRFYRIFIPYTLMQLPFWLYYISTGCFNLKNEIIIFSTLGFWLWHMGAWYVALLVPLYFLSPFIYKFLYSYNFCVYKVIILIVFLVIISNVSIESINNEMYYEILKNLQWTFARVPSFIIGMSIAPLVKNSIKVNSLYIIIPSFVLYVIIHQINANIFAWWCIVPAIIIIIILFETIKINLISKFISWMGNVSLESYLANIYLCELIKDVVNRMENNFLFYGHYIEYLIVILLGLFMSGIVYKISGLIIKKLY